MRSMQSAALMAASEPVKSASAAEFRRQCTKALDMHVHPWHVYGFLLALCGMLLGACGANEAILVAL